MYIKHYFWIFITSLFIISCNNSTSIKKQPTEGKFSHPEIVELSKKIDADPKNASYFFDRGLIWRKHKEDSLAILDFQQASKLDSTKAKYFSAVGEILFEHKDVEQSIEWFKKAIAIDSKDPISRLKYAKLLMFINENQKSFEEINTVLRRDPYNAEAYFLKGILYKNTLDTNKAISSFQTSVQVDPLYQPSILQLAMLYAVKKDTIAIRYFENAYQADPTQLVGLYGKGMFYQEMKQFEKAKKEYYRCLEKDSTYFDAQFNLGWIFMHQDSLTKAVEHYDKAIKSDPKNTYAYYNRGLSKELSKDFLGAKRDYELSAQLDIEYQEPRTGIKRIESKK
jgi:tetratricopeptide (TPR) repeat protein